MPVMIDIETMSVHCRNALILSCSVVEFSYENDAAAPTIGAKSEWVLDPREQLALGRQVDKGTSQWWQNQSEEARIHWMFGKTTTLANFAIGLADAVRGHEVWSNGIVFDIGNLEGLLEQQELAIPWKYNVVRDARTIYRVLPERRPCPNDVAELPSHHPTADCIKQIWSLWQRWPEKVS